jgi:hypothetical protein
MKHRVVALHQEHPDLTAQRIAAEMDCDPGYVRATAQRMHIKLPYEAEARQAPASGHPPAQAPELPSTAERQPAAIRPPVAAIPSGAGSAVVTKPMVRPKGTRFYLRDEAGNYLHYSCTVMTSDKAYAWSGTHDQLLACRRKFELARDLSERPVPREAASVA